jgi:hypothetical protein
MFWTFAGYLATVTVLSLTCTNYLWAKIDVDCNRYTTKMKVVLLAVVLAVALAAPAGDKVNNVPVFLPLVRATLQNTTPASTPAISMSRAPTGLSIMSLFSPKMERGTKIRSPSGSMEDPAAAHSLVPLSSFRIPARNRAVLPGGWNRLQGGRQPDRKQLLLAPTFKPSLLRVTSRSGILDQYGLQLHPQRCHHRARQSLCSH